MPEPERRVRDLTLMPSSDDTAAWQNKVSPQVRNSAFFSARVEDERLLAALQQLVDQAVENGWSVTSFVEEALKMLDAIRLQSGEQDEAFRESFDILYDINRLRLIYRTQKELAAGFRQFVEDFDEFELQVYPAWEFYRQEGAKEQNKRPDHIKHEGAIRLKTDIDFWLARNSPDQGGFGNPYGPWGFNSWMRTRPVDRETAEKLGLIKPGERLTVPAEYAPWNINNAIKQLSTTSVVDLDDDQRQRVIDDCDEEGIDVVEDPDEGTMYVPEPETEPEPAPKRPKRSTPAPEPAHQPEPKPEPRKPKMPEQTPAPEPTPKRRKKPQLEPERVPDTQHKPRRRGKPQPEPERVPEPKTKRRRKPQTEPAPEPEQTPAPRRRRKPEQPAPEQEPAPKRRRRNAPLPEHEPQPEPEIKPTEPETTPEQQPEQQTKPEPQQTEPAPAQPESSTQPLAPEDDIVNVNTEEELEEWIKRQNAKLENMSEEELLNMLFNS